MARSSLRQLLAELERRRVYRVAAVYVVVAWVLLKLGNIVVEPLHLPGWTMTMLILLLVLGLPLAVILAWAFDITPEGVRRTAPRAGPEGLAAAQTALGTALATTGRLAEGQAALERAAELNPNDRVAIANLGSYHGQLGLWEQATAYVTRALEVDPEHHLAFFLQGVFGPDRDAPERLRMRAEQLADRAEAGVGVGTCAAEVFALLGDAEGTALGWNRSTLLELTRGREPLRPDPRFQEVYDRIDARRIEVRDRVVREGL